MHQAGSLPQFPVHFWLSLCPAVFSLQPREMCFLFLKPFCVIRYKSSAIARSEVRNLIETNDRGKMLSDPYRGLMILMDGDP